MKAVQQGWSFGSSMSFTNSIEMAMGRQMKALFPQTSTGVLGRREGRGRY